MLKQANNIINQYHELNNELSSQEVIHDLNKYKKLVRQHKGLKDLYDIATQYKKLTKEIEECNNLIKDGDSELKDLAKIELTELLNQFSKTEEKIKILLIPKDPNDSKNVIVEIRCGTGGDEAALFAEELYRMYSMFSENNEWKIELISMHLNEGGGIKEVIFLINGKNVYSKLKFESGVHRVQRVPETESSGRVHTSAATVAILPEAEDVDITVNESDIKIDTYRASGAGGQHVNKTESAIRITHIPSGVVVTCQDESSQHKNKDKALKVLKSKLYENEQSKLAQERADIRKTMVSTGDRSMKIRTYNFPQGRITDHRINLTLYKLNNVLNGDLNELIDTLSIEDQKAQLDSQ